LQTLAHDFKRFVKYHHLITIRLCCDNGHNHFF